MHVCSVTHGTGPVCLAGWLSGCPPQDEEEFFAAEQERARAAAHAAWEHDVAEKHRLAKMAEEKEAFAEQVSTRRAAEFAALKVGGGVTGWGWLGAGGV